MPAEVRNQIYRYTLVEVTDFEDDDSWIVLDQSTAMQPALLRCCRQIREEAFSIYWEENAFWLVINDLKLAPQTGHWIWQHSRTGHPEPRADSTKMVWGNLLEWLHLHWQGDERFQQVGWGDNRDYPPVCGRDVACLKAFELVEECRGMDWARTKRILDLYGEAVEGKSRWDWAWE